MSKLTDHEREILDGKNFLFIATLNPDGSPQVSPVWVETKDDLILINTSRGRVKERNMSRIRGWPFRPITTMILTTK